MRGGAGPTTWMAGKHILQPQEVQCRGKTKRICAETGVCQQAAARNSPAGLPQDDQDKDSAHDEAHQYQNQQSSKRFSKTMMEMKRNKTAVEPKKQDAGARNRVTLEEEDRVKFDRWMTKPKHKVRTVFPCCLFTMSFIYCVLGWPSNYHQLTISFTVSFIHHAIHSPCPSFNISSIHHVILSPCHPFAMSPIHHVNQLPFHTFTMSSNTMSFIHYNIHTLFRPFTMSSIKHVIN